MEKKSSLALQFIGLICLLIGLGPGVFLLTCGIMLIITQIIFITQDARGYAGAFGAIAFIVGIVLSVPLIPAVNLLKLKVKYLIIPAVLVALFPIYFGVRNIIFEKQIHKSYLEQKKNIEAIRPFQDRKIIEAFSQNKVVPIGVKCSYALYESEFRQRNKGKKATMNMQFINDNFVEPAGRDHIFKINFVAWTYFYAQVTREGYDQLKNNIYVEYIELQEREGAMSSHKPSSGLHKKYYSNGQLDREWMIDQDGASVWLKNYYITGEFHVDVKYTNGGRDRLEKEYYKSGKIKSVQQYKDYKLVDWKDYDEEGNLVLNEGEE